MTLTVVAQCLRTITVFLTTLLSSEATLATSPPPPPLTLEESLISSSVVVAKGVKIHWLSFQNRAAGTPPRVVSGPTYSDSHEGSVVLEADIVEAIYCDTPCESATKIFIRLDRYQNRITQLNRFLSGPMIYIVRKPTFKLESAYPSDLLSGWHVLLRDTRDSAANPTNPLPLSERVKVESALEKARVERNKASKAKKGELK